MENVRNVEKFHLTFVGYRILYQYPALHRGGKFAIGLGVLF
jgi:hypothetical protein